MPYEWVTPLTDDPVPTGHPVAELHLWPYRSLPRRGFAIFMGVTAALVMLPMLMVVGTMLLWGLLPFVAAAFGLTWYLIERSYRDGDLIETLTLWPDRITVLRRDPNGEHRTWDSNIYWARADIHPSGGPVRHYITLTGNGRTVELGAFLSEEERQTLYADLIRTLPRAAGHQ